MAVVAHVVVPGITTEQYDQVREAVGWLDEPPACGLSHVTWWDGGDCHNILGSAVQREHGLRIRPVNCGNSADPGMPGVYLGVRVPAGQRAAR
jgi:hypothetical protein